MMIKIKFLITLFFLSLLVSDSLEVDESKIEITYPPDNKLVAAGFINIQYKIDGSLKLKNAKIYINNEVIGETTDLNYEYYTTKVQYHNLNIEFELDGEDTITKKCKFGVTKKGIGVNDEMGKNLKLTDLNVAWYFNWYNKPSSGDQYNGIEFVPMIWSEKNKKTAEEKIDELVSQKYKYAFLFNEPDRGDQANMSVEDVYDIYRSSFQNKKILISAPMTSIWPDASDWFQAFMAKDKDLQYDFIVLHVYPDNFSGAAMAKWFAEDIIDKTYLTYKKDIWINEFSTIGNNVNEENTIEFYKAFIPLCNERSYVVRYSPFGFKGKPWSLWDYSTGDLTPVGKVFAETGNPE